MCGQHAHGLGRALAYTFSNFRARNFGRTARGHARPQPRTVDTHFISPMSGLRDRTKVGSGYRVDVLESSKTWAHPLRPFAPEYQQTYPTLLPNGIPQLDSIGSKRIAEVCWWSVSNHFPGRSKNLAGTCRNTCSVWGDQQAASLGQ